MEAVRPKKKQQRKDKYKYDGQTVTEKTVCYSKSPKLLSTLDKKDPVSLRFHVLIIGNCFLDINTILPYVLKGGSQ